MANSDGIQKLLLAETEAGRIVAEARKGGFLSCYKPAFSRERACRWPLVCVLASVSTEDAPARRAPASAARREKRARDKRHPNPHSLTLSLSFPPLTTKHTAKTERLRQAKAEAEKEIAAYRAEREAGYQKRLAEVRQNRVRPRSPPTRAGGQTLTDDAPPPLSPTTIPNHSARAARPRWRSACAPRRSSRSSACAPRWPPKRRGWSRCWRGT